MHAVTILLSNGQTRRGIVKDFPEGVDTLRTLEAAIENARPMCLYLEAAETGGKHSCVFTSQIAEITE